MNILVPDAWLREYLDTKATPTQIKEYLSLCGPSVERINQQGKEIIYEVEITSNRPDSMSIFGIAREAGAILPRFGIAAHLKKDPYAKALTHLKPDTRRLKKLNIKSDASLNPRWVSVVIDNITIKSSPIWLQQKLELTGIRALNNIIDITNYLMRAYGQPVHAFDYDEIKPKNDVPTMILRAAKKSEHITTLDGKNHILAGGDIVIEDGSGRLIDLCGIMGAQNSSIKPSTKTVVLFMQTYNPAQIRKTSMSLAHRTEAAALFEKGVDEELALPTMIEGIKLIKQLTGGKLASQLNDIYPKPFKPYQVSVSRKKIDSYIGKKLTDVEISQILASLGLKTKITDKIITACVPSFRRDIEIDVDIIEEIARLYGYHRIESTIPDSPSLLVQTDAILTWEDEVKMRLRDWGFTETYTYSIISEELMDIFELDKQRSYKISNPLSLEWVYMRPSLWPSMLSIIKPNLKHQPKLKIFELSMIYQYRQHDLPVEKPMLLVCWTGKKFYQAKGLAEYLFNLFGIPFPPSIQTNILKCYDHVQLQLGDYGSLGQVNLQLLNKLALNTPVTILELDFEQLVKKAKFSKKYVPIPKYPAVLEDLTFVLPPQTPIGEVIGTIKSVSPLINQVKIKDKFGNAVTFSISYLNPQAPLMSQDVDKLRSIIVRMVTHKFKAQLKGQINS